MPSDRWSDAPFTPADVFAAAAYLLEASGAYQYIVAPFSAVPAGDPRYEYERPTFAPSRAELDEWVASGRAWALAPLDRALVQDVWARMYRCRNHPLVVTPTERSGPADWWKPCHALLVIADEASGDFGYDPETAIAPTTGPGKWANRIAMLTLSAATDRRAIPSADAPGDFDHFGRHVALDSLCTPAVDRHVARVLPKGRTTEIGCTLRTFSHNLTLLPPHGQANAYWHQRRGTSKTADPNELNVMLVPFPYVLPAASFRGAESRSSPPERRWGRFQIDQRWLRPDGAAATGPEWSTRKSRAQFVAFIDELISEAEARCPVHGIALPELALDWETYDALVRHLRDRRSNVEFVVAGVSRDCNGRIGNQVTTSVLHQPSGGRPVAETHSRGKHHRWQVDGSQVSAYGIGGELDPDVAWWEHLPVGERVLHVDVFREGSTLTAVICEDLARVEPGLSLLRSLGPNLVFALLMDGPQLKNRWPGIYATALADDPGSSVLSLTCAGMVDRSNASRTAAAGSRAGAPPRRTVALWKNRPGPASIDPPGDFKEIDLPKDGHAVVLRLRSTDAHETTMDGRSNADARAWFLRELVDVRIEARRLAAAGWGWISGS